MPLNTFDVSKAVAGLCRYGADKLGLSRLDSIYAQNGLLELFGCGEPAAFTEEIEDFQTEILTPLVEYAVKHKLCAESDALLFETKLMGYVTPSPGAVVATFDAVAGSEGIEKATSYLFKLSEDSNYIRMPDIKKNIRWTAPCPIGDLTITINLSKPEKDNKKVAEERKQPQTDYPKCPLCVENVGFQGNAAKAARQTLRVIPIPINNENWYFQFSPYVYYDNHCIAFSEEHKPMRIDKSTFQKLFDFAELFPHYFIGSNSDLPIVGGSILSHEHYQGGKKVMPMLSRSLRKLYKHSYYKDVEIGILDWYNSVIRLKSANRRGLIELASSILDKWKAYGDADVNIIPYTDDERHNTVTPIAALSGNEYVLYLILRNNRTDAAHPEGIFHPTEDMHNIKKESIGLIEAMGVFILPGRLYSEIKAIADILTGKNPLDFKNLSGADNPLSKHLCMIAQLTNDYGVNMPEAEAEKSIVNFVNQTCVRILECTAVFKNNEKGQTAFDKFMKTVI